MKEENYAIAEELIEQIGRLDRAANEIDNVYLPETQGAAFALAMFYMATDERQAIRDQLRRALRAEAAALRARLEPL